MRKVFSIVVLTLIAAFAAPAGFAAEEENEAKCHQWAKEDGIKADELNEYLEQCLADLRSAAEEEKVAEPKD